MITNVEESELPKFNMQKVDRACCLLASSPPGPAFTNVPMTATDTSTVVLGDTAYTHDANGNLTSDAIHYKNNKKWNRFF